MCMTEILWSPGMSNLDRYRESESYTSHLECRYNQIFKWIWPSCWYFRLVSCSNIYLIFCYLVWIFGKSACAKFQVAFPYGLKKFFKVFIIFFLPTGLYRANDSVYLLYSFSCPGHDMKGLHKNIFKWTEMSCILCQNYW